jgi:hypothetical protein
MSQLLVSREPIKVIADIIKHELDLADGQIMLDYEKINILPDPGLYVAVSYLGGNAIGNNNYFEPVTLKEIQEVAMQEMVQIDILSFDASARTRKEEVIMALRSIYSQNAQDANSMQIARIPGNFQNASSLEETKILNRFTMAITIKAIYRKEKAVDYYDKFPGAEAFINGDQDVKLGDIKTEEIFK